MTQSIDNSEWVMQNVIRDPVTGALLRVNADGSINVSITGGGAAGTGTSITGNASITLNSNGIAFNGSGLAGTGVTTGTVAGTLAQITLNSAGISFLNPEPFIASYENMPFPASSSLTVMNGASISGAVAFLLPQNGSFSYIRMPVSMSTNSTTLATTGASLFASAAVFSTWNAVVYALGTGASSNSLQSVASGSAGWTQQNSISVAANGTQYSITQAISGFAAGAGFTSTTQYSISNTNYSFVTSGIQTLFSGTRWLDINFATSLSAGPYWMVFGFSSSSATNSTGVSAATNALVSYSYHFAMSQLNVAIRPMGSTNGTASGFWGVASFSTAGGGTTNSLDLSNFTSYAGFARPYFVMQRQV